jgi:hypothetical protein
VAETLKPGASVSIVARRRDVNANRVFKSREIAPKSPAEAELFVQLSNQPDSSTQLLRLTAEINLDLTSFRHKWGMPDDNLNPVRDLNAPAQTYVLSESDRIRGDLRDNQRALEFIMGQIYRLQRGLVLVALIATIAGAGLAVLGIELLGGRL